MLRVLWQAGLRSSSPGSPLASRRCRCAILAHVQRAPELRGEAVRRREFTAFLGGAAAWPLTARAQQSAMPVIGFLDASSREVRFGDRVGSFQQGLSEAGYVEGRNATIEYRWAEGNYDRLPALGADLVRRQVAVIAAAGTPAALAAKAATPDIPVIFETAGDPVALGLVASLNRPGGNVSGVTQLSSELIAKRIGLLHDLIPSAKSIGLLVNPKDARAETQSREVQEAAQALGLQIHIVKASTDGEIDPAFAELIRLRAGALAVGTGEFLYAHAEQLAAAAARYRLPAIYQYRLFVQAGGLISYGASLADSYRLAGVYTGRVLKGEKPADMPIARATKFGLVINLKTAHALGLSIPPGVLAIADEVIE